MQGASDKELRELNTIAKITIPLPSLPSTRDPTTLFLYTHITWGEA